MPMRSGDSLSSKNAVAQLFPLLLINERGERGPGATNMDTMWYRRESKTAPMSAASSARAPFVGLSHYSFLRGGVSLPFHGSGAFLLLGVLPGLAGSSPRYLSSFRALIASTHLNFLRIIFQPIRERRSCRTRP